jgi:RNA polymerase sigma-70 factor (ECF subfamily)
MVSMHDRDPLRALLDAAREGDDVAVRALVRATQPALWRLCSALGSPEAAEDLVQDTYARAFRSLDRFRGDSPVMPWFLAIARHVCADHVRSQVRQRRLVDRLVSYHDGAPGRQDGNHVQELVDRLDPDRRDAFVLTQVVGLSYDDAAATLGCPVGTIRSRVARARADLMQAIAQAEAR